MISNTASSSLAPSQCTCLPKCVTKLPATELMLNMPANDNGSKDNAKTGWWLSWFSPLNFRGYVEPRFSCGSMLAGLVRAGQAIRLYRRSGLNLTHPQHEGRVSRNLLEQDDLSSNRHPALIFSLSMIFSENRFPLFRIML
jgi:hypothetical protein